MSTAIRRLLPLLTLVAFCALSMTGCNGASNSEWIKPEPPRVSCKQARDETTPAAPRADEWVARAPAPDGRGEAVWLSEKGAAFIADLLALLRGERAIRGVEHGCLDDSEKKGLIVQ